MSKKQKWQRDSDESISSTPPIKLNQQHDLLSAILPIWEDLLVMPSKKDLSLRYCTICVGARKNGIFSRGDEKKRVFLAREKTR